MAKKPKAKLKKSVAFQDLLSLPPEKLSAIDTHILTDGSATELVRLIQEKWGLLTEKAPDTLRRMLYRYKRELIEPKQIALVAKFSHDETVKRVAAKVDELGVRFEPITEMEKLVYAQMKRVEKMAKVEENAPTLLDAQTKNIMVLHTMLKDLSGLHMDVGLLQKVPMTVKHEMTQAEQMQSAHVKTFDQEREATLMALEFLRGEGILGSEDVAEAEIVEVEE